MKVTIDSNGLAYLQQGGLAVGLARPSPGGEVSATLAFSLPATSIIGSSFSISVSSTVCGFATGGVFGSYAAIPTALLSPAIARSAIAATGAVCTFAGNQIGVATSPPLPEALVLQNNSSGHTNNFTMGLAETFSNTADNTPVQAATLAKAVDTNMRWTLTELPTQAYLFTISDTVQVGTVLPPPLYLPQMLMFAAVAVSITTSEALLVDLSQTGLVVSYSTSTNTFVVA